MFNMTKIRASNAAGKSFYANHLASNDYYSEHEKVIGFWRGSLAERFGLAGQEVTGSVFSLFQKNINPATGDSLTQKKVSGGPRFFDFQVAAPKSVSVMSLFDERLIAAHQSAVREAMRELESLAAVRVRTGENVRTNNHENTGKLIYAEFMHDTSRALDPQLHTHNVVCNVTLAEGKYKALETLEMCKAIRYAGKVYHNALARQCRELGYDLIPVLDKRQNVLWFDLAGVPSEVMERFSKRRKQIEEAEAAFLAEHGRMPTLAENNAISSSTRSFKMQTSTREAVRTEQMKQLPSDEIEQLKSLVKPDVKIPKISREAIIKAIRQELFFLVAQVLFGFRSDLFAGFLNLRSGRHFLVSGQAFGFFPDLLLDLSRESVQTTERVFGDILRLISHPDIVADFGVIHQAVDLRMSQIEMLFAVGLELLGGTFQQCFDFDQSLSQSIVLGQIAEDLFAQLLQLSFLFRGEFFGGSRVHGFFSFLRFFVVGVVGVVGGSGGLDVFAFFFHFYLLWGCLF